jgi:hypothetical protein
MAGKECEIAELRQWESKIAPNLPFAVAPDESLASTTVTNDSKFQTALRAGSVKGNVRYFLCDYDI